MSQRFYHVLSRVVLMSGALAAAGCSSDSNVVDPGTTAPTFTSIQTNILTPNCTGCHAGSGAPEGMVLTAGSSYAMLVGVASNQNPAMQRVKASAPDDSYIIAKLEGNSAKMKAGTNRMPSGGPFLTAAQIKTVRDWIAAGAKND